MREGLHRLECAGNSLFSSFIPYGGNDVHLEGQCGVALEVPFSNFELPELHAENDGHSPITSHSLNMPSSRTAKELTVDYVCIGKPFSV